MPGALARLKAAVVPPAVPIDARGDWRAAEEALGVELPADYKWLVETYGWGEFCDFLNLHTPFGSRPHNGLAWRSTGGLLVWGSTIDADRLCWRTDGSPGDWPVVIWDAEGAVEELPVGAGEFVAGWSLGLLESRLLGAMEPGLAPWFNAFRTRTHRCVFLSEGPHPYAERLRILRDAFAPTADRGSWESDGGASGQDHFAAVADDWLFTYDRSRPHQIRVGFPPEDAQRAGARLFAAVRLMGCEVRQVTTGAGTVLPAWETRAPEDTRP
ncbi:hypothetical protein RKD23_007011 [Streptomyces sp. SAI-170]|uniref:SMI1/KNR4 family protein n=1 Tax=Streptomyces sp. SAI-170 TaxID=3377729 RepID=UPI003C7D1926